MNQEPRKIVEAIEEGKIVGYIVGGITKAENYRKLPKTAELENMLVLKEYRNKGIGKALYESFAKWCKEKKVKIERVLATAQNAKAIKFYKSHGFKEYSVILERYK